MNQPWMDIGAHHDEPPFFAMRLNNETNRTPGTCARVGAHTHARQVCVQSGTSRG